MVVVAERDVVLAGVAWICRLTVVLLELVLVDATVPQSEVKKFIQHRGFYSIDEWGLKADH